MRTIYPQPGYAEADTTALLATKNFQFADCYTITPKQGAPMYYTTARGNVTVVPIGGIIRQQYLSRQVLISGMRTKTKIGVEVDQEKIGLDYTTANDYQSRIPWPKALLQGLLDGATVKRDRFFAPAWAPEMAYPWISGVKMFAGAVAGIDLVGRQSAVVNVKSALNVLDTEMPRDLFTPNCKNILGDAACGVDLSTVAVTATVTSTASTTFLPWTASLDTFADGKVFIDNGDSVTRIRKILKADATGIWLVYPLDFIPIVGQTFTAYPGCIGTMLRCQDFHGGAWQTFFKGFPFIPVAESAI